MIIIIITFILLLNRSAAVVRAKPHLWGWCSAAKRSSRNRFTIIVNIGVGHVSVTVSVVHPKVVLPA